MNKKQEERLNWMKGSAADLTFEEKDGIIYVNNQMILENGDFRSIEEGGKGTDSGYVIFTGYPNGPPLEPPPQQEPEQYKDLKWPPDPWWK